MASNQLKARRGDLMGDNYIDGRTDGKVDCTDISVVKAAIGKKYGQAGFDPRADTNKDCVVDVRDLAFVFQKVPAGTKCP